MSDGLGLPDIFGLWCAQLQLAVDRQGMEDHRFRAILVGERDSDPDPTVFFVNACTGDDGVDFAIGFGHGG